MGTSYDAAFEIIGDIVEFEKEYKNIRTYSTTKVKKETKVTPLEGISPDVFHKGFAESEVTTETITVEESNFMSIIRSCIGESSSELCRGNSFIIKTIVKRQVNKYLPLLIPNTEISITMEPAIALPNYAVMFFDKTEENLNLFQPFNINAMEHIVGDAVTTKIILDYTAEDAIAIMFILIALNVDKTTFIEMVKKSKSSLFDELKNNTSYFDRLYASLEVLNKSASLTNRIASNLYNSIFNFNVAELLSIIGTQSNQTIVDHISKYQEKFAYAKAFCEREAGVRDITRQKRTRRYVISGVSANIIETVETIQQTPAKRVIKTNSSVTSSFDILKGHSLSPIMQRIQVLNGTPASVNVSATVEKNGMIIINYGNQHGSGLSGVYSITLPVTNWGDAVMISNVVRSILSGGAIVTEQYNGILEHGQRDLPGIISDLLYSSLSFSLSYNNKLSEVNITAKFYR